MPNVVQPGRRRGKTRGRRGCSSSGVGVERRCSAGGVAILVRSEESLVVLREAAAAGVEGPGH
jgi:hypothetical protein